MNHELETQFKQLGLEVPLKEIQEIIQVLPLVQAIKASVRKTNKDDNDEPR